MFVKSTLAAVAVLASMAGTAATAPAQAEAPKPAGQPAADDLQRITVDGSANATNYAKFSVAGNSAGDGPVLSWRKVPFGS